MHLVAQITLSASLEHVAGSGTVSAAQLPINCLQVSLDCSARDTKFFGDAFVPESERN